MKIAVATAGASLDAPAASRFGGASFFVVVETETGEHTAHDNSQHACAAQGATLRAAELLSSLGVDVVITSHCGPKAFHALQACWDSCRDGRLRHSTPGT